MSAAGCRASFSIPEGIVDNYGDQAIGLVSTFSILSIAFLLIAIGLITGLARTISREYGFRLSRTETGLRRERGLFTRTDVVIPLKRIQAGIITTGIVKRLFGWRALAVQSLGSDGAAGTHHIVAPLAQGDDIKPILDELDMPEPPPPDAFQRVSRRLIWRSWLEDGIALAIITGIAAIFWDRALLILLAAPVLAVIPVLQYRAHGYCIADGLLFVRRGFWRPRLTILPLPKVQSGTVRRNLTQRLLGISTVAIGTAGASLATPLRILDIEEEAARALLGTRIITKLKSDRQSGLCRGSPAIRRPLAGQCAFQLLSLRAINRGVKNHESIGNGAGAERIGNGHFRTRPWRRPMRISTR